MKRACLDYLCDGGQGKHLRKVSLTTTAIIPRATQSKMSRFLVALLAIPAIGFASAKPEQIRAVQDPIFHLYLQAYPGDRRLPSPPEE